MQNQEKLSSFSAASKAGFVTGSEPSLQNNLGDAAGSSNIFGQCFLAYKDRYLHLSLPLHRQQMGGIVGHERISQTKYRNTAHIDR